MNTDIFTTIGAKEKLLGLYADMLEDEIRESKWVLNWPRLEIKFGKDQIRPFINWLVFRDCLFNYYGDNYRDIYEARRLGKGFSIYDIYDN